VRFSVPASTLETGAFVERFPHGIFTSVFPHVVFSCGGVTGVSCLFWISSGLRFLSFLRTVETGAFVEMFPAGVFISVLFGVDIHDIGVSGGVFGF
jgi:hypothetical protein